MSWSMMLSPTVNDPGLKAGAGSNEQAHMD